jgi:ubiquitin C-terminal hydrolase
MSTLQDEETPVYEKGKYNLEGLNALESWAMYESTHPSVIDRLFTGLLKTTVTCGACHFSSVTYGPYMTMSLAFETSLDACIRGFVKEDYIEDPADKRERYKCERCLKRTRAKIKTDISKRPQVQVFHIKRF